ncbi:MAG: protein kinase [Firmicutes bacterium]|nr:protein kinase [Bacillota bacterium]
MEFQLVKELGPETLLVKNSSGEKVILDKASFAVTPRESFRLELQKKLKEIVAKYASVEVERVVHYQSLEKFQGGLYLARKSALSNVLSPLEGSDPERLAKVLLEILEIMKSYHQADLVLGGLSPGQLKQDTEGRFVLQDPPFVNHLGHLLEGNYRVDLPSEVVRGGEWDKTSDIFSWGQLAYQLLTGRDPFEAKTPEERVDKIMRHAVLPPRTLEPRLGEPIAALIVSCLNPNPTLRPRLDDLLARLGQIIQGNTLLASGEEAAQLAGKAKARQKQYEAKEKVWRLLRRYGLAAGIVLAVVLVITITTITTRPPKIITEATTPREVLNYYFQSIRTLDVSLMEEALSRRHRPKNSFETLITNLYVMNRAQQGYTQQIKDYIILTFPEFSVQTLSESADQARYLATYTLKVNMQTRIEYFQRQEELILTPVKNIWRLTDIKIRNQKQWSEEVEQASPTPMETGGIQN